MLSVTPIPAFADNYIWLLRRGDDPRVAVVDPGDAAPVLDVIARENLVLSGIIITHHHADHTGGVRALLRHADVPVYGPADEAIPGRTHALREGDRIHLPYLDLDLEVIEVPGHTAGHIAYYGQGMLFCGDTLFAGGCGRLFEGTPAQMHASLSKLANLPDDTRVYCAHEYTQANLRFAIRVEPDNADLQARGKAVSDLRRQGHCTLPSTIGDELKTNPFLRSDVPAVKQSAEKQSGDRFTDAVGVFAAVRRWKDAG